MTTGKSKADFPGAYIPFDKSVGPVPTVSIDSAPTSQLCINDEWLPFVIGALKALTRPETWSDGYDASVIAASEVAALIAGMADGCGTGVPSILCVSGSFKDLDYGFVPAIGAACDASWIEGTGWSMCCDATPQGFLFISRDFGVTTLIREVHFQVENTAPAVISINVVLVDGTDLVNIFSDPGTPGPHIAIDITGLSQPANAVYISIVEVFGGCIAATTVTDFGLCYTGAFPLSSPPEAWEIVVDFSTGEHGFVPIVGVDTLARAVYSTGVGWTQGAFGSTWGDSELRITKSIASAAHFTSIQAVISTSHSLEQVYFLNIGVGPYSAPSGSSDANYPADFSSDNLRTDLVTNAVDSATITLSRLVFRGIGPRPSGID